MKPGVSTLHRETPAAEHPSFDLDYLVQRDRVHSSIYTDPAIFDAEMERIFHTSWVYVGHESEVPKPGDFQTRDIGRQPIILVRGRDDLVRVFMNRCTHRGASVCVAERGNKRLFSCAYHGWSFANTGELAGVPQHERYGPEFQKADYGLRQPPRVERYKGLIFASLARNGQPFEEYLGPLVRAEIDFAMDFSPEGKIDVSTGVHKYDYAGNWKLQLENSVDAYHLAYLHRSFFKIVLRRTGIRGDINGQAHSPSIVRSLGQGHISWDFSPLKRAGVSTLGAGGDVPEWQQRYQDMLVEAHGPERAAKLIAAGSGHVLVFPNLVMINSHIRLLRPQGVQQTEVFLYPVLLQGVPPELNQQRLRGHESFYGPAGGGATDDLEVFERQADGFRATVDPWILLSRGLGKEQKLPDGSVTSQITDELSNRSILHHWKQVMAGGTTYAPA